MGVAPHSLPMKMRFFGCVICLASALCPSAAWAQDASPVNLKEITAVLKQIKDTRAAAEKMKVGRVLQDFRAAAASNATAIAFYEQAVGATQYDGKTQMEFQEWKKREADRLKSNAMQNAARLHLSYLLLTIQRAGDMTTKQLEPALLAHIAALSAAGEGDNAILARRDKAQDLKEAGYQPIKGVKPPEKESLFWEQDLINRGVESGIFAQWYGISKLFSKLKDWENSPGNVDGHGRHRAAQPRAGRDDRVGQKLPRPPRFARLDCDSGRHAPGSCNSSSRRAERDIAAALAPCRPHTRPCQLSALSHHCKYFNLKRSVECQQVVLR